MTTSQVKFRRFIDEPTMSDNTLLLKLEDLIYLSFGASDTNIVNVKMLQSILLILARQMRMLEQDVEIKFADEDEILRKIKQEAFGIYSESSSEDVDGGVGTKDKGKKDGKAAKGGKDKSDTKDGQDGKYGKDGKDGKGGRIGRDGKHGKDSKDGQDGKDGIDGKDGRDGKEGKGGKGGKDAKGGKDGADAIDTSGGKDTKGGKDAKGGKDGADATDTSGGKDGRKDKKNVAEDGTYSKTEDDNTRGKKTKDGVDQVSKKDDTFSTKGGRLGSKSSSSSDSRTRIGSIEVVTASKFNLLESMVQQLLKRTGGVPLPTMPSNEDLLADLAKGTAKLPDTMEAMQVNARIRAAEEGLTKMAGLLTHLAASGALPPDVASMVTQMQADLEQLSLGQQPASFLQPGSGGGAAFGGFAPGGAHRAPGMGHGGPGAGKSGPSTGKTTGTQTHVTHPQMKEALSYLRDELLANAAEMTDKSEQSAVHASQLAKSVGEKMEVAMKLDRRITDLNMLTEEYAKELHGFDNSLKLQLDVFREQMSQLHTDLGGGIQQFESLNNNSESAALTDIRTTFESLQQEMENTMTKHSEIVVIQKGITDDLKGLMETIETLCDQKADRDEVADGLRDKAKISRLNGFLRQDGFQESCDELDQRLSLSYDIFSRQNKVWMNALSELTQVAISKISITELASLKDFASAALTEQAERLRKLEEKLGEPKAALLARQLSRNGHCGACVTPAFMDPVGPSAGAPHELPALRPPADQLCAAAVDELRPVDTRKHVCKRWVGGSHTLVSEHVTREHAAPPLDDSPPTKKYAGRGKDGHVYHLEKELKPCAECNKVSLTLPEGMPPPAKDGGGDW